MKPFPFSRATSACISASLLLTTIAIAQSQSAPAPPPDGRTASVVIVLDNSRSARNNLETLRRGAEALVSQFSSRDELALYLANDKPTLAQDFTGDTSLIANQLKHVRATGKFALFETLSQAMDHARSDAANEQSAVIAFVNDLDLASGAAASALQNSIRNKPGVPVFVIALRQTSWKAQEAAQKISVLSGGAAFFPEKSSEVSSIARTLAVRLGGRAENDVDLATVQPLSNYRTVNVRNIPIADNGSATQFSETDGQLLQRMIISRLQRAKVFADVRDGASTETTPVQQRAGVPSRSNELDLLPMVVAYRQPPTKQRQFLSPFVGGSRLRVQVVLRDHVTHEPVAAFVEEASASQGWFSGSDERNEAEAMMSVTNKIIAKLRDLKKQGKDDK